MKYIVYQRFKGHALCGNVNIPALTECEARNGVIYHEGKAICLTGSENAHCHFAINDDGNGLCRGKLVQKIINTLRTKDDSYQNRWDRIWNDVLCQKYKRTDHKDHWLWNNKFYCASMDDLEHIYDLILTR